MNDFLIRNTIGCYIIYSLGFRFLFYKICIIILRYAPLGLGEFTLFNFSMERSRRTVRIILNIALLFNLSSSLQYESQIDVIVDIYRVYILIPFVYILYIIHIPWFHMGQFKKLFDYSQFLLT